MQGKQFYDLDHARQQLPNSLVRFEGRPVYIYEVNQAGRYYKAAFLFTDDKTENAATLGNAGWDFNPVPLGFLGYNVDAYNKGTAYICRSPQRMWKIGLAEGNLVPIKPCDYDMRPVDNMINILTGKALAKTILNQYPTLKEAYKISHEIGDGVAFSRRFCVEDKYLFYKYLGIPVGETDGNEVNLYDSFSYLKEVLAEDMNNAKYAEGQD